MVFDLVITSDRLDSSNASWVWPGESEWQFASPGDSIISDCKNWYSVQLQCNLVLHNFFLHLNLPHFISVHVRLGFCSVIQSLVAMWTVAGANGVPGLSARFLVEEESSSGNASVITRLLRLVGEAALELLNRRKPATFINAQVVLSGQPKFNLEFVDPNLCQLC